MKHAPNRSRWLLCSLLVGTAWAADAPADAPASSELAWSLGLRLKMDDASHPGQLALRPTLGLRYGRWRTGEIDGESWYRFGLLRTDTTLTYDLRGSSHWRSSLSASIVNMENNSTLSSLKPGRKTLRARATLDYIGWPDWNLGVAVTQDLLDRGAGSAISPSISYRYTVNDNSTILLSHSFNLSRSDTWRLAATNNPDIDLNQPSAWGSTMDTSVTLRQRRDAHWNWYVQLNRSQILRAGDPTVHSGQTGWAAQAGLIYFDR